MSSPFAYAGRTEEYIVRISLATYWSHKILNAVQHCKIAVISVDMSECTIRNIYPKVECVLYAVCNWTVRELGLRY